MDIDSNFLLVNNDEIQPNGDDMELSSNFDSSEETLRNETPTIRMASLSTNEEEETLRNETPTIRMTSLLTNEEEERAIRTKTELDRGDRWRNSNSQNDTNLKERINQEKEGEEEAKEGIFEAVPSMDHSGGKFPSQNTGLHNSLIINTPIESESLIKQSVDEEPTHKLEISESVKAVKQIIDFSTCPSGSDENSYNCITYENEEGGQNKKKDEENKQLLHTNALHPGQSGCADHHIESDSRHGFQSQQKFRTVLDFMRPSRNASHSPSGRNRSRSLVRITGMLHHSECNSPARYRPSYGGRNPQVSFNLTPTRVEYAIDNDPRNSQASTRTHRPPSQLSWYSSGSSSETEDSKLIGSADSAIIKKNQSWCGGTTKSSASKYLRRRGKSESPSVNQSKPPFKTWHSHQVAYTSSQNNPTMKSANVCLSSTPPLPSFESIEHRCPSSSPSFAAGTSTSEQSTYLSNSIVKANSFDSNSEQNIFPSDESEETAKQNTVEAHPRQVFDGYIHSLDKEVNKSTEHCYREPNGGEDHRLSRKEEIQSTFDSVSDQNGSFSINKSNKEHENPDLKKNDPKKETTKGERLSCSNSSTERNTEAISKSEHSSDVLLRSKTPIFHEIGEYHRNVSSQFKRYPSSQLPNDQEKSVNVTEAFKEEEYFRRLAEETAIETSPLRFWRERRIGTEPYNPQEADRSDPDSIDEPTGKNLEKVIICGGGRNLNPKSKTPDALRSISEILDQMSSLFLNLSTVTTNLANKLETEL